MPSSRLARAAQLIASGEAWFTLRAWVCAPLVELALDRLGLDTTLRWIRRAPPFRRARALNLEMGEQAVRRAYRFHPWFRGACLSRAIVQCVAHRCDGTAARLVIGVRGSASSGAAPPKSLPGFGAHAWVQSPSASTAGGDYTPILTWELP